MTSPADAVIAVLDEYGKPFRAERGQPLLRADDLGVVRGESVFETMRAFAGRPFQLPEHLDRLAMSADRVQLVLPAREQLVALVEHALESFGSADASLRLVSTKGPEGAGARDGQPPGTTTALVSPVSATSVRARQEGVSAVTLTLGVPAVTRAQAPWLLGGVKSTSYAPAMAALRAAAEQDAADAVYVSLDGEVLEAPTASVVVALGGEVVTPPEQEVGILPSTTVGFFGPRIARRRLSVDDLRSADEVMLLSSVRGVVPVLRLDGQPVGTGAVGPRTEELRGAYEAAVRALQDR